MVQFEPNQQFQLDAVSVTLDLFIGQHAVSSGAYSDPY